MDLSPRTTMDTASASSAATAATDLFVTDPFYPLETARNEILAALRADESSPDADLFRRIAHSANSYDAGAAAVPPQRQGFEYRLAPATAAFLAKTGAAAGFVHGSMEHRQSIPLPSHLAHTLAADTKLFSLMGAFPEAHMVWLSVDNTLYLWEYQAHATIGANGRQDYVAFEVPSGQCIVSVGLVPPKPGVFKQVVEWCIVVATPEEIILCALTRSSTDTHKSPSQYDSVLRLIPTSFIIPTDSVPMLSVQGTRDGRILLGGYDGCMYEMAYEGFLTGHSVRTTGTQDRLGMEGAKDYYCDETKVESEDSLPSLLWSETMKLTSAVVAGTKRTITHLTLGEQEAQHMQRARKCRKINHTSFTPSILQALVPNFILRAATSVLSFAASAFHIHTAGPITQLEMDHDRRILYALTQRGFVHAFSVPDSSTQSHAPIQYACTVDLNKSAHRYLENVARAKPFPPTLPLSADAEAIAAIVYPGGASAAAAGVGGMDNARFLLKVAHEQATAEASKWRKDGLASTGILHPISIHVVLSSASQTLTLVAITAGGLRYYLSVLPHVANSLNTSSTRDETGSTQLGRRFTLAHIRSPPPFRLPHTEDTFQDLSMESDLARDPRSDRQGTGYSSNCIQPGQSRQATIITSVSRALYWEDTTWLAVNHRKGGEIEESHTQIVGDSIITLTPDSTLQCPVQNGSISMSTHLSGSGLAEIVSFPTIECRSNSHESSILGGGHIWSFSSSSNHYRDQEGAPYSSVRRLIIHSKTPSDTELSAGMVSPFIAPPHHPPLSQVLVNTSKPNSWHIEQPRRQSLLFSGVGLLTNHILQYLSLYTNPKKQEVYPKMTASRKYRISFKAGCSELGFDVLSIIPRSMQPRTASRVEPTRPTLGRIITERLSSWLLRPREVNLPTVSFQHPALSSYKPNVVALNSGGVHIFSESSPMDKLKDILSSTNAALLGKDEKVQSYFFNYGFMEACVMCLSLAITSDSDELKAKAIQAALSYAHRPTMIRDPPKSWIGDVGMTSNPENLTFQPSYLYKALVAYSSRLLRPIWYKPAIVVTEGKSLSSGKTEIFQKVSPAKVELLLDEITLQEIRRPLISLQNLIRIIFSPVIECVPDFPLKIQNTPVKIDLLESNKHDEYSGPSLLTQAMKSRVYNTNREAGPSKPTDLDILQIAKLTEERKIHSLYRLLSRTVQLLNLMSHLRRAHFTPELPDVEFGLLHGLTYCHLVTTKSAHERIDIILSNLLSASVSPEATVDMASIESSNFATLLGNECYLWFSTGCRYSFLGFKLAHEALKQPTSTTYREELSEKSAYYLRKAALNWTNVELISGRIGANDDGQISLRSLLTEKKFIRIAKRALEQRSPLARAASILMELEHVSALVDVCLICARNFGAKKEDKTRDPYAILDDNMEVKDIFPWERDLYHKYPLVKDSIDLSEDSEDGPFAVTTTSSTGATAMVGVEVSRFDALTTCYAVLFYYIFNVLTSSSQTPKNSSHVDVMISTAASSTDTDFLHLLYEFLLTTDNVDKLLRIESIVLARWLRFVKNDLSLLWRHFTLHGLHSMAGQVMLERAHSVETNVTLEERIESLTRAVNSFSAALENDLVPTNFDFSPLSQGDLKSLITQTNETIEVAMLQKRIIESLNNLGITYKDTISSALLGASDLYNDYAAPNSLYDLCLLIMHTCEYQDHSIAGTLWKSIFCEEILPCKTRNPSVVEFLQILKDGSLLECETVTLIEKDLESPIISSLKWFEQGEWVPSLKGRIGSLCKELKIHVSDEPFPISWIVETLNGLQKLLLSSSSSPGYTLLSSDTLWSTQLLMEVEVDGRRK